ncbi:hypothetical protein DB30_05750 [Enhygromyxa salina]|uniref:Uncharacterized protein n=1 Tax=Enhygromyxa salina TaxID=215803 RepID=A0A0C1ZWA1_9BACT|nr:hypothetical protein DB30_05750 [Enhygromyxa salina]
MTSTMTTLIDMRSGGRDPRGPREARCHQSPLVRNAPQRHTAGSEVHERRAGSG